MTLEALRCLCAVLDTKNFHRAAEQLHRSQPAISQQLKTLEREYDQVLVDRKTMMPTPAGRIVYTQAVKILEAADSLQREIGDFDEEATASLRIGSSDTSAVYFLPSRMKVFSKRMPQTRVVVVTRSSDEIADEVQRGDLDLGIVTLPIARDGLESRALFEQQLVLVTPRDHPLHTRRTIDLRELKDEPFIRLDIGTRTGGVLETYFVEQGFTPQVVMDSGSFEVIKRYVQEGLGISILPEMVLDPKDRKALSILRVKGLSPIPIGAVWRGGVYQTRAARVFLDVLGGE